MKPSKKKANVTPLTPPAKVGPALPPVLVAGMFAEAGVLLRPGRADAISAALGKGLAKFRDHAHRMAFEREPGLFPAEADVKKGKR